MAYAGASIGQATYSMSGKTQAESHTQAAKAESAPATQKSDMRKQMEEAIDAKITPQFDLVRAEMKGYFEELSKEIKSIKATGGPSSPKP
jgi:hypothetical protein